LRFARPHRNQRPLIGLLAANAISQFGNTFSLIAIPWFVLETTGSASQTGISVATGVVPFVIVGILSGSIVDRIGYKRASVISDLFSFVSSLLIPVLYVTRGLEFWQLLVLVFIGAFFDSPGISARQALLPELAQMADVSHERANTAYSLIRRFAGLLGPPAAGIVLAATGATNLLFFNAITFAVSALIVAIAIPDLAVHRAEGAPSSAREYLQDIQDGFHYLASNRLLIWLVVTGSIGSLIAEPLYTVILPVYANEVLGSAAKLGFMYSALAAGSILGNFLYLAIEARIPRGVIQIGGFAVRALAFSVMVFLPDWWVIAVALFIGAVALEPVNPMLMSILQEQVPPGMRARIYGVGSALFVVTAPIGIVAYGFLISSLGMEQTLAIFVVLNLALPVIMLCVPALRHIPRLPLVVVQEVRQDDASAPSSS
jgi:MFS family permease